MNTAVVHFLIEVRTPYIYLTRDQRCLNKEFIATYEIYGLNVCSFSIPRTTPSLLFPADIYENKRIRYVP